MPANVIALEQALAPTVANVIALGPKALGLLVLSSPLDSSNDPSLQFLVSAPPPLTPIVSTPTSRCSLELFSHLLAATAFVSAAAVTAALNTATSQLLFLPSSVHINSLDHCTNGKNQK